MRKFITIICLLYSNEVVSQVTPNFNFKDLTDQSLEVVEASNVKVTAEPAVRFYYETMTWYNWKKLEKLHDPLTSELTTKRKSLKDHVEGTKPLPASDVKDLEARVSALEGTKQKPGLIETSKQKVDSAYLRYIEDFIAYRRFNWRFGPVKSTALGNLMRENNGKWVTALNSTGVSIGSSTASIYSDLLSGSIGFFHISLGQMVALSSDDTQEKAEQQEAFQRLALAGGNTVLKLEYPLFYIHTRNNSINLLVRSFTKGSADIPKFGNRSDSFAGSLAYGADLYLNVGGEIKGTEKPSSIRAFAYFNFGRYKGNTEFKDNLEIETTAFNFGQLSVGIIINNSIKISLITNTLSSVGSLRSGKPIVGGELIK